MTRGQRAATQADRAEPAVSEPVLLASIDGRFPARAVREAVRLAGKDGAVYVISTARILGSAFGLPHPGLYPSRRERETHRQTVADVVRRIERLGPRARGEVLAARHAAKMLARRARQHGCAHIVVSAGPRPRLTWLSWAGEPYRVQRRAQVPVHVIVDEH